MSGYYSQSYQPGPPQSQPQGPGFQPGPSPQESSLLDALLRDVRWRSVRDSAGAGAGLSTICLLGFIGLLIIVMYIKT